MTTTNNTSNRDYLPPLDVATILTTLRDEVRSQRFAQGQHELTPLEQELRRSLDEIELSRVVSAHWPLLGKTPLQRVIVLINKVVRRYLRWYINPIVEQQNAYNNAVAHTVQLLAEGYTDLKEQLRDLAPDEDPSIQQQTAHQTTVRSEDSTKTFESLKAEMRHQAVVEPPAHVPDVSIRRHASQLRLHQTVTAHWPLNGVTLHQRIGALHNKIVRRYLRWYINPIVEQQNTANTAFATTLLHLVRLDAERRAQVAQRRAQRVSGQKR
ncbi:MAG: hypothetical protein AAGF95_10900 [Chloroflexota bacterium]